ncbi:AcrR family transcriptional regulator [Streptosporangium album]|uniref:AcrR family transcriptional regulator n=1 Tax=Streptosporangium album TaxID=47479 RepID=A0A7W7RY58_9ACTN|nr:TetR/AcrR family transcriptional regulator [Streptosporangium album]MBB4939476.1 AcrR family transcriptional regulator [Streptosporangium album]
MQANFRPGEQRTFTEQARRAQIIEAAVEVIAEVGSAGASFAKIAKQAGLSSTGLITYHFANRQDLINSVVGEVMAAFAGHVGPLVDAQPTPADALDAFVGANVGFIRSHRKHLLAVLDIAAGSRATENGAAASAAVARADLDALEDLLARGQRQGQFRQFDPRSVAIAIRSLRDGILGALTVDPGLDLDAYGKELRTLVRLMTAVHTPGEAP